MATSDISRVNFDPTKHYAGVQMQQGRVLTDDDWNENERIANEDIRRSLVDIIGPYGSPDNGFRIRQISSLAGLDDAGSINFLIQAGTMYLGGLRLELEASETYRLQKDWLEQPANLDLTPTAITTDRYDLVYIEVWQQIVCAVEDESLFEVALGGPDTTTRLRTMRRVHIAGNIGFCDCSDAWNQQILNWQNANQGSINADFELITDAELTVTFSNNGLPEDLCTPNVAGGYLGADNQAIRVQLIDNATFTWGFDNASPYYKVTIDADGQTVHMLTDPKDQYHWPLTNQIVEILPWSAVLSNGEKIAEQMGYLSKVDVSYNPDAGTFTLLQPLVPPTPYTFGLDWESRSDAAALQNQDPAVYFYMRVWDRGSDLSSDPAISIGTAGTPVTLGNTGLQVTITGTALLPNDYWIIAARPETPNQVVPWDLQTGVSPNGVRRFYAPLAIIDWSNASGQIVGQIMHDCRKTFSPLTADECCCTYSVGDGVSTFGNFNSIQDAIDSLPLQGGKICVLPGEHTANVLISQLQQVQISGCGDQTIVRPAVNTPADPIFLIQNSQKVQIENLTLYAVGGTAIALADDETVTTMYSENIKINNNQILALTNAIYIQTAALSLEANISILHNSIGMIDNAAGLAAIFCMADEVLIERNRIVVVPAPNSNDPGDPRNNNPGNVDPFNPCRNPASSYQPGFSLKYQVYMLLRYVYLYIPTTVSIGYQTMGGIQIGTTSERVCIRLNEIIGGRCSGVLLGGYQQNSFSSTKIKADINIDAYKVAYSALYEITIEENQIQQMGLAGIGVFDISGVLNISGFASSAGLNTAASKYLVSINDLTIFRNIITGCALQIPTKIPDALVNSIAFGGIVLSYCENGKIQQNRIEYNGNNIELPFCGIFMVYGEKIDISGNYIINNRLPDPSNQPVTVKGSRGGIVVRMTFKPADMISSQPSFDGVPALKVYDNEVIQPLGHALYTVAFGPVSVEGNQLTSQGIDSTNPLSVLAGCTFILNLGVSKDLLVAGFSNMINTNPSASQNLLTNPAFQTIFQDLQYLPSGRVMFTGNQSTLDLRSADIDLALSSQLIGSLDDIGFNNNQSECAGFISFDPQDTTYDFVLFNSMLFGVSVRSNDNRFTDGFVFTLYSLFSYGLMNTAIGNQSTHCLIVLGYLLSHNSNIVFNYAECSEFNKVFRANLAAPTPIMFN